MVIKNPERLVEVYNRHNGIFNDKFFLGRYINNRMESALRRKVLSLYFEKYPRRKKVPSTNVLLEQEKDLVEKARQYLMPNVNALVEKRFKQILLLEELIKEQQFPQSLSSDVFINPARSDSYVVMQECSVIAYNSQPARHKYARCSLFGTRILLENAGYNTYIEAVKGEQSYSDKYVLYANCPRWVKTKVYLQMTEFDLFTIYYQLWKNGCHPLVIYPTGRKDLSNFILERLRLMDVAECWNEWNQYYAKISNNSNN